MKIIRTFSLLFIFCMPFVPGAMGQNAPIIADTTFYIDEYSDDWGWGAPKNGTRVGVLSASDPDGDALSLSIIDGNKDSAFGIDDLGNIEVKNQNELDFETNPVFTLTVEARDDETVPRITTATITIKLNDMSPNDLCTDAISIAIGETASGTSHDATEDGYIASDCGPVRSGSKGVWYRIVGNGENITVSTCSGRKYSSAYNPSLRVFRGSCQTGLLCVGGNLDAGIIPQCGALGSQARLNFLSEQDVKYFILVDGKDDYGNTIYFDLTVSSEPAPLPPANDHCQNAQLLTVFTEETGTPTAGDNTAASAFTSRTGICSNGITMNDVWYTFNSGANVEVNLKTTDLFKNNLGWVALYDECRGKTISCFYNPVDIFMEVQPNKDYWIQVWNRTDVEGPFTIQLNDGPNTAPTIKNEILSISKYKPEGTVLQIADLATDSEGHAQLYSFTGGNDDGVFSINEETGDIVIADATALVASSITTYELTVRVDDQGPGSLSSTGIVTVNVVDNAFPVMADKAMNLNENTTTGSGVTNVDATDADGDGLSYQIIAGNTDNAFSIDGDGNIEVSNQDALDFETNPVFELIVEVEDDGPLMLKDTSMVTLTLNNVNEKPEVNNLSINLSQHSANGFSVIDVDFEDEDEGQNHSFAITGGNTDNIFAIGANGEITVNNATALSGNGPGTYDLTVTVSDDGTPFESGAATISLTAVDNNSPSITSTSFSVFENARNRSFVGQLKATDVDGDKLAFSLLGSGAGVFKIDSKGIISVANNRRLDFETNPSFNLLVRVEDDAPNGSLSSKKEIRIDVKDLNEPPTKPNGMFRFVTTTTVTPWVWRYNFNIKDPENDALSYRIEPEDAHESFNIDEKTGDFTITFPITDLIANPFHILKIVASDGKLESRGQVVVQFVVNAKPQLTVKTFEIDENSANGTLLGQLASDDIHPIKKFEIASESENEFFVLGEKTGELKLEGSNTLDYESNQQFDLKVFLTDGGLGNPRVSEMIRINVNDINEAPVLDSIGNKSTRQNEALTFTAVAADEDINSVLSYALDDISVNKGMRIDASTGVFNWTPDYDQFGLHTVEVTVSDGLLSDAETITIEVIEINDFPPVLEVIGNKSVTVGESLTFTVTASDEDKTSKLTFTLDDASKGKGMSIDANTGVFNWTPDNNQLPTHTVEFTVSDGSFTDSEAISIEVLKVLGLEDPLKHGFVVYPNPATHTIEVSLDNPYTGQVILRVLDLTGKELMSKSVLKSNKMLQSKLDISTLGAGIYSVELNMNSSKKLVHRVIKE